MEEACPRQHGDVPALAVASGQAPRRVHLNIRKHVCAVHITEHWHRFLTEAGEPSSLEMSQRHLDMVLGTMLWVALLEQSWTRWT